MTACDAIRRYSVRAPAPVAPLIVLDMLPHIIRGAPKWGSPKYRGGAGDMFVRVHEGAGYENGPSVRGYAIVSAGAAGDRFYDGSARTPWWRA